MKSFLLLSFLVSMAMSASVLPPGLLSNLRAHASASASASPQVSVLRLSPDGRVVEVVDQARLEQSEQVAVQQRAREALGLSPLVSATSSASLFPDASPVVTADRRVVDSLEVRLAKAAEAAARRNEQIRLAAEATQVAQAQIQQQLVSQENPLLSATRLAHTLASLTPTGASSSSRAQLVESPELTAARLQHQQQLRQQQQIQQNLAQLHRVDSQRPTSGQTNAVPLVVGPDGQLVPASVLVL